VFTFTARAMDTATKPKTARCRRFRFILEVSSLYAKGSCS
jgi:hypothetical protein